MSFVRLRCSDLVLPSFSGARDFRRPAIPLPAPVDRCADEPALDYPLAAKSDLEEVAARHGAAVRTMVGDVWSRSDMRAAVDEAIRHFGGCRLPPPWPASQAAAHPWGRRTKRSGTSSSTSTSTGCATWPRRPCRRCFRHPSPVAGVSWRWHRPRGCSVCPASAATASKHAVIGLVRSLAADLVGTGITANAVCPGSTRVPMLDASAAVYGLASAEEFAVH